MTRWSPRHDLSTLQQEMEEMFNRSLGTGRGVFGELEFPELDLFETEEDIALDVDLPGLKPEELDLSVTGNTLTLKGERREDLEEEKRNVYRRERRRGSFVRSITLPSSADTENVSAHFEDGVLHIRFPKRAESKARHIPIG